MADLCTGENDAEEYEIEEIVSHRKRNDQTDFLVKWKGYDHADNSWEAEKNVKASDLITRYWEKKSHQQDVLLKTLEERGADRDSESRSTTPDSESSSDRDSPSTSISSASSASFASARMRQDTLVENISIDRTPTRPPKSVERASIPSKSIEKDVAGLKSTPTGKPNTLAELNKNPVSTQKRPNLPPPPPLPIYRKRPHKVSKENNSDGGSSASSSRSTTPHSNVTIRSKRSKTPLVEGIEEVIEIVEETESSSPVLEQEKEVSYDETLSQIEKGHTISQILSIGKQNGIFFALLQYCESNVAEWVIYELVRKLDPQAIIKFHEATLRQEHKI